MCFTCCKSMCCLGFLRVFVATFLSVIELPRTCHKSFEYLYKFCGLCRNKKTCKSTKIAGFIEVLSDFIKNRFSIVWGEQDSNLRRLPNGFTVRPRWPLEYPPISDIAYLFVQRCKYIAVF